MDESPVEKIDEGWKYFKEFQDSFRRSWHKNVNRRTFLIALLVATPLTLGYYYYVKPPTSFPSGGIITITEGNSLKVAAKELEDQHVVASALVFEWVTRVMGGETSVHSGDYIFKQSRSVVHIAQAIMNGYFGLEPVRIRIPEGTTAEEMAPLIAKQLPRFDIERFIEVAKPHDGYLYPDTYFFLPNATEEIVLQTLRDTFTKKTADLLSEVETSGYSLEEIVIIASLLEKEAHIYRDRRMIAQVIYNRLDINMPLQIDAAFLYFLGRTTFTLTREDLRHESPYNTYRYKGLPPGPITNPSYASLKAALEPIPHNYIFYLADRNGVTYYSETYEEHLQKKRVYLGT